MVVRLFTSLALFAACAQACAESAFSDDAVRSLGAQIAHAADRFDHGTAPSSIEISNLDHQLELARASVVAGTDRSVALKFTAIAMRFEMLKFDIAKTSPSSTPNSLMHSQIDVESVSAAHGASCTNALGISPDHPVRLTLPKSSNAWFFMSGAVDADLRFRTTSAGPDPSLEVFDGCGADAKSIASNDDTLGLDAQVVVANARSQTLFVRLTNSGESGIVTLDATAASGTVNGTVKDAKTSAPITNGYITLYSTTNGYSGNGYTDQNGNYSATAPQPGTYYVVASAQSYVTQLYPTGYCPYGTYFYSAECDSSHARTVTVTATGSVSNINFSLSMGQKISGQVRATDNTPLIQSSVLLLMPNGQGITSVNTDNAGHFVFSTLPPSSYVIQASAQGYGSQLYDNVPCAGPSQLLCNALAANPVIVGSQDITDVDFRLPRLSAFIGTVTGSDGQPVNPINLVVVDINGNAVAYGETDNYGNYTAGSIGTGTYYIFASGYTVFSQLYPGHDCISNCIGELSEGTAFTFTSVGQNIEADFVLDYLPTLSGHITDATTGSPLRNVQVLVNSQPPSMSGYSSLSASTDGVGNYDIANIPPGQYFVWAQSIDHVDQVYSGVICEATNYYSTANCNVAGATLLTVTPGEQTVPSFDFALSASSSISGHAGIRAGTGSDIPAYITATLYDGTGISVGYASSDANGNYVITDVAPGTYYAVATPNYYGSYISQIWQGIDCSTCVATTGTPIVLATSASATGVDFQVTRLDAVVGRVVDDHGTPVSGVVVDLFSSADQSYTSGAGTDQNGFYVVSAAIGSSYYVATEAGGGYTDQVYSGISCANGTAYDHKCPLAGGTPINLNAGATQPHIVNFVLIPNDRIFENGFD